MIERQYREPTVTCLFCFDIQIVTPSARGFPPDIAKKKLAKRCKTQGHECQPHYLAGIK